MADPHQPKTPSLNVRIFLDANILLDSLVLESDGLPRIGKVASDQIINLCDAGVHHGLVAWHTLPIIAYYHGRQNTPDDTAKMIDELLTVLEIPTVSHHDAASWRTLGPGDFEDALQLASAIAGSADVLITRNTGDFVGSVLPIMTPEQFLATRP